MLTFGLGVVIVEVGLVRRPGGASLETSQALSSNNGEIFSTSARGLLETSSSCDFFQLGLSLTVQDTNIVQEAIYLLAGDPGLGIIQHLIEVEIPNATSSALRLTLFVSQVLPLLGTLSAPVVAHSSVLEPSVNTILIFIVVTGGLRSELIFNFFCDTLWKDLTEFFDENIEGDISDELEIGLECSLAVFSMVLDGPTYKVFTSEFPPIAERFLV
ncbi:Fc.00g012550.m01.CDS01 [Cosmosporella sp. VM-42]